MKEIFDEYGTRILGYIVLTMGTIGTLATTGAFNGLLEEPTIRWVAIAAALVTTVFGGATVAKGSSNATQIKVAEAKATVASAMETALNTPPPASLP